MLAQEWYGALAREIFNPNYVLLDLRLIVAVC